MTFLTMAPWLAWTLLAATAIAITVIFFLRIQHRRVLVSSSLLWDRVLEKRKRQSWIELLRRLISLLIALLIGLALAGVLTGAERGGAGLEVRNVRIVVDNGISMGTARSDGLTRLERAAELATDLLARGSAGDTFTLLDRAGRVLVPATRDRERVREALAGLEPVASARSLPAYEQDSETWLISDGVALGGLPDEVELLSVFEPADNAAVSAFEIRPTPLDPFRHEAFLEVLNASPGPRTLRVELRDERGVQFRRDVELESGGLYRNTFDLSPLEGGPLYAAVEMEGDALPLDDRAVVWLPRKKSLRLLRVAEAGSPLDEILATEPHVELTRMTPAEYDDWLAARQDGAVVPAAATTDPLVADGVLFDRWAPESAPPLPALVVRPPSVPWLPGVEGVIEEPGPPDSFAPDPLLRHVDLHDLRVDRAMVLAAGDYRVLAAAGATPLLVAGRAEEPWLLLTFDLSDSDLAQTLSYPILISNLVEWVRNEPPMLRAAPGRVRVALPGARIATADGRELPVRDLGDRVVFTASEPGLYWASDGLRRVPISIVAGSRAASSINASRLDAATDLESALPPHRVLWPILLGLAAALLLLEGVTYHRRVTV